MANIDDKPPSSILLDFVHSNWNAIKTGKYSDEENSNEKPSTLKKAAGLIGLIPSIIALPIGLGSILLQHAVSCLRFDNPKINQISNPILNSSKNSPPSPIQQVFDLNIPKAEKNRKTIKFNDKIFTIKEQLGTGASKIAYKMTSAMNEIFTYLKIHKEGQNEDETTRRKNIVEFSKEIEITYKFKGKSEFIQVYAVRDKNNQLCGAITEYCDQGDLFAVMTTKKNTIAHFEESVKKALFTNLANAAVFMEEEKIIHHDLKPENILVKTENGKLVFKIADFGLAKPFNQDLSVSPGGSPWYIAPECMHKGNDRSKSDLWSIGIIMYMIYFEEIPKFIPNIDPQENPRLFLETLNKNLANIDKDKNLQIRPGSPDSIKKLIKDLLQVDPNKRPTAKDFQERLNKIYQKVDLESKNN